MTSRLQWEVFVSAQIPVVTNDFPPGASDMKWSPISSTLISGKRDAVLVDTAITVDQNQKLVDWMAASGKNLTTIYATHGHGDHFFGVNTIQKKFPKARFVATREVIAVMQKQASAPVVNTYWKPRFPGQIDSTLVVADALKGGVIELEGEQLVGVPLGHTDTDNTTCLHAPSIGLVVAGDAVYNDVHLHLGESNAETRNDWIAALDKIESLKPVAVIAGHKRPGAPDTPNNIEETRKYIRDFDRIATNTKTASELYNQMLAIYPERVNPAVLWLSARAMKPGT
ncbi:MAG: MBL fold metallo-hydrolase [Deltaproteobacteria bacterium]|jgi:glyoxylase-like metal-dependent hydrolase (beta-lactamase superfamily II)|nr:MAG: MBL fold metallo-hydrolase [Deltaproteobacteria bacterium]HLQ57962.1 MBL fold metallo-hydrolase [Gemmatimonadales bacterium]